MQINENDNYIMFDGKKIPLTDEQIEMIKSDGIIKENAFGRVKVDAKYCFIDPTGSVTQIVDVRTAFDTGCFYAANYCTDEDIMEQRALHETLNRLLWRYSVENGEADNPWDSNHQHCYIYFDVRKRAFEVGNNWCVHSSCEVYFPTEEVANKAITDIVIPFLAEHKDFVW